MFGLIAEGYSGEICEGIPTEITKRIIERFLVGGIPGRIFDGIPVVIYWEISLRIYRGNPGGIAEKEA